MIILDRQKTVKVYEFRIRSKKKHEYNVPFPEFKDEYVFYLDGPMFLHEELYLGRNIYVRYRLSDIVTTEEGEVITPVYPSEEIALINPTTQKVQTFFDYGCICYRKTKKGIKNIVPADIPYINKHICRIDPETHNILKPKELFEGYIENEFPFLPVEEKLRIVNE